MTNTKNNQQMIATADAASYPILDTGSYRDRNGQVYIIDGTIIRGISQEAHKCWSALQKAAFFKNNPAIIETEETNIDKLSGFGWYAALTHHKIPFISYPYEWSFGMLKDAALLQLDLLLQSLAEGFTLKDATPFNFQFIGTKLKFIDIGSFELYRNGSTWIAYRQFCEMFLFPLMLTTYKDLDFHTLLRGNIDGIPVSDMYKLVSFRDYFRPGVVKHIVLQKMLEASFSNSTFKANNELKSAGFGKELILANLRSIRKLVASLNFGRSKSTWGNYVQTHSYNDVDFQKKQEFVNTVAASIKPRLAWDLGCNTGIFSKILAQDSDTVVAIDGDHKAVQALYSEQKTSPNEKILPLVMNLAATSPGLGWLASERKALHARGKPDLVIALAVIHHLVISANIPLKQLVEWFASLTDNLIIEYVDRNDEMVKKLLANKVEQYNDYSLESLISNLNKYYRVETKLPLKNGDRVLIHATK